MRYEHFVEGKGVEGKGDRTAKVFNPALGSPIAEVPLATPEEIDACVKAAKTAFPAWADTPMMRRARIMFEFKRLLGKINALLAEAGGGE